MTIFKRTEEEFDKLTALTLENGERIGRIINYYDLILSFIHQAQVDAIKEFVDGIVPEKDNNFKKIKFDGDYEKIVNKQISDAIKIGYNLAIDEIQERINNKLKEI